LEIDDLAQAFFKYC